MFFHGIVVSTLAYLKIYVSQDQTSQDTQIRKKQEIMIT